MLAIARAGRARRSAALSPSGEASGGGGLLPRLPIRRRRVGPVGRADVWVDGVHEHVDRGSFATHANGAVFP